MPYRPACYLVPFILLMGAQQLAGHGVVGPIILADEFGYLATAAYLAGLDWSEVIRGAGYYSFGYSLLIVPGFLSFDDPEWVYRFAQWVNAALAAGIFALAYSLSERLAPGKRSAAFRMLAAVSVSLYPSYRVYATLAWAETTLAFLYWLSVLIVYRLQDPDAGTGRYAVLGVLLAFAYAVHPRAGAIVAAATAVVVTMVLARRTRLASLVAYALSLAASLGVVLATVHHLKNRVWSGEVASVEITKRAAHILTSEGFVDWVATVTGQVFYVGSATWLTAYVGFAAGTAVLVRSFLRPATDTGGNRGEETAVFPWFAALYVVAAATGMLTLSSLMLQAGPRADHVIYGRYNEAVLGPLILLGILKAGDGILRLRHILLSALILFGAAWLAASLAANRLEEGTMVSVNVTGLRLFLDHSWHVAPVPTATFVVFVALPLLVFARHARLLVPFALACAWTVTAVSNVSEHLVPASAGVRETTRLSRWLGENASGATVHLERTGDWDRDLIRYRLQFWYPEGRIVPVHSLESLRVAETRYLITAGPTLLQHLSRAALVHVDYAHSLNLWVFSSPERERLQQAGRIRKDLIPASGNRHLPPPAYRSRLDVLGESDLSFEIPSEPWRSLRNRIALPQFVSTRFGPEKRIRVRVVHDGDIVPWPRDVKLGAFWIDPSRPAQWLGEHRATLPSNLAPSGEAVVTLTLRPRTHDGSLLPPGEYLVMIGLVHENVGWFSSWGDHLVEVKALVHSSG